MPPKLYTCSLCSGLFTKHFFPVSPEEADEGPMCRLCRVEDGARTVRRPAEEGRGLQSVQELVDELVTKVGAQGEKLANINAKVEEQRVLLSGLERVVTLVKRVLEMDGRIARSSHSSIGTPRRTETADGASQTELGLRSVRPITQDVQLGERSRVVIGTGAAGSSEPTVTPPIQSAASSVERGIGEGKRERRRRYRLRRRTLQRQRGRGVGGGVRPGVSDARHRSFAHKVNPSSRADEGHLARLQSDYGEVETILLGDSIVREQELEFAGRCNGRRVACAPGKGVVWLKGAIADLELSDRNSIVGIHIGTNDLNNMNVDAIAGNFRDAVGRLREKTDRILLTSILPRPRDGIEVDRKVRQVNGLLGALAGECGAAYVDLYSRFRDAPRSAFRDGLHLSDWGAARMGRILDGAVKSLRFQVGGRAGAG